MLKIYSILCFFFYLSKGEENFRIIDGDEIDITKYPYVVSLRYNDNHVCGGVILDKRTILTSNQCLFDLTKKKLITIRHGSAEHANGREINVAEVILYPKKDYIRDYHENDIGLAKLSEDLVWSNEVKPIKLPYKDYIVSDNKTATFVGWGVNKAGDIHVSPTLRNLPVTTLSYIDCTMQYGMNMIFPEMMICAQAKDREFCRGDLGGPLVIDEKVVGIASWIYDCDESTYPGVYTNVARYRHWIDRYLERPSVKNEYL